VDLSKQIVLDVNWFMEWQHLTSRLYHSTLEVLLDLHVFKLRLEEVEGSWRMTPLIHTWSRGLYLNPARLLYKTGRDFRCFLLTEMKCAGKHTGNRYFTHYFCVRASDV